MRLLLDCHGATFVVSRNDDRVGHPHPNEYSTTATKSQYHYCKIKSTRKTECFFVFRKFYLFCFFLFSFKRLGEAKTEDDLQ